MSKEKNTFWEAYSESSDEDEGIKLTFEQIKKKISNNYEPSIIHTYSSALDILASFIKSQAFIYNEASNFCRFRLNMLMFPCIFLSSLCSVFSNAADKLPDGIFYISCVNAFISFLLAIVNFLKLDACAEAHQISSNHYYKLRTMLEFSSGEILLFSNPLLQSNGIEKEMDKWKNINKLDISSNDIDRKNYNSHYKKKLTELYNEQGILENQIINNLQSKILDIKKKVIEIRESNRFSVPKYIMSRYPVIFNINIFSFIKTVSDYRNGLINKLKNVTNEIRYIGSKKTSSVEDKERIKILYDEKQDIMSEMIALSSTYNLIDIMFQQEIKNNILFKKYYYLFYTQKLINYFTCSNSSSLLPNDYKSPYDCGYYDKKNQQSLLKKILNS